MLLECISLICILNVQSQIDSNGALWIGSGKFQAVMGDVGDCQQGMGLYTSSSQNNFQYLFVENHITIFFF